MDVACAHCGKVLSRPPSRVKAYTHQFCDSDCHDRFRERRETLPCAVCGSPVTLKASRMVRGKVACGPECLAGLRSQQRIAYFGTETTRQVECEHCGKTFVRKPSRIAKNARNFCSLACKNEANRGERPDLQTGEWLHCENCNRPVWRTPATVRPHTFCSRSCAFMKQGPPAIRLGEDNPAWRGGRSLIPYGRGFDAAVKAAVKERDGHRCQICHRPKDETLLAVHHIDRVKTNNDPGNLVSLCLSCHRKVHHGTAEVEPPA